MGAYIFEGNKSGWTRSYPVSTNAFGTSTIVYDKLPFADGTSIDTNVFYRLCEFSTESGNIVNIGSTSTEPCENMTRIVFGNYDTTPAPVTPTTSGGGVVFNPNLGPVNFGTGIVSPISTGQVLGASTTCGFYMNQNGVLGMGLNNNKTQVELLQKFLNSHMNAGLVVNGIFDANTKKWVEAFQNKYASDILAPWGLQQATGVVYYTTLLKINNLMCAELKLTLDIKKLIPVSNKPN